MSESAHGVLAAISETIETAVRRSDRTLFFACFIQMPWGLSYVSNGDRPEIQRLLPELVRRMSGGLPAKKQRKGDEDGRLAVERVCGEVGKRLAAKLKLALLVFKNSTDCPDGVGVNAYFTNLPSAPEQIRAWLAKGTA